MMWPKSSESSLLRSRRIALVLGSLRGGGAERVASILVAEWVALGADVCVVTLDRPEGDAFEMPDSVDRLGLDLADISPSPIHAVVANIKRAASLRRCLQSWTPDLVVSFIHSVNVLSILAGRSLGIPVVVSERTNPTRQPLIGAWRILRRIAYPRATALVVQSEPVRAWAAQFVPDDRVHCIPNPVAPEFLGLPFRSPEDREPIVLGMGRLGDEKDFPLLIRSFAAARPESSAWHLRIIGEGEARDGLDRLVRSLRLTDTVALPGWTDDPVSELANGSIFVLSSLFEGFSNVLLEAMAAGMAVVAVRRAAEASGLISDGENGILTEASPHALGASIKELMQSPARREALGRKAQRHASRYGAHEVARQWGALFQSVSRQRGDG